MTQKLMDEMPALLSKKQFQAVTGLERRQIAHLVRMRLLRVWRPMAGGYAKYYKADAAKMAGYAVN